MATVGIIGNPAAGKDVRRLVAHASIVDNNEKVNVLRRTLPGLDAAGVDDVLIMPDSFDLGIKAIESLPLSLRPVILDLPVSFTDGDSTRAWRCNRRLSTDFSFEAAPPERV